MAKKKAKVSSESSIDHVKQLAKDAIKKGKRKVLTAALELAVDVLHKLGTGEKKAKKVSKKVSKSAKKAVKKGAKKVVEKAKKTVKKAVKKTKKATAKKKATKK